MHWQILKLFRNYTITFYETQSGAETENARVEITDSANFSVENKTTSTIYVRIEKLVGGCYRIAEINLLAYLNPGQISIKSLIWYKKNLIKQDLLREKRGTQNWKYTVKELLKTIKC